MKNKEPELIVYSGGFDPPHAGHAECVKSCLERFKLADVLVVPSPSPAGANGDHKTTQIPFRDRMKLCMLQFQAQIQSGAAKVSNIEESLTAPNYSVNTLRKIKEEYPDRKLGFLIGRDQLANFHLWKDPIEVLKLSSLVAINRENEASEAAANLEEDGRKLLERLKLAYENNSEMKSLDIPSLNSNIFYLSQKISPASSTVIRQYFTQGHAIPRGWLLPPVESYIKKNGFFSKKETEDEDD